MVITKAMIRNLHSRSLYALIDKHANPREVYTNYLLENGEADAKELAKEMEKKFWADLQERLDEIKQNPLPYTLSATGIMVAEVCERPLTEDFDAIACNSNYRRRFQKDF